MHIIATPVANKPQRMTRVCTLVPWLHLRWGACPGGYRCVPVLWGDCSPVVPSYENSPPAPSMYCDEIRSFKKAENACFRGFDSFFILWLTSLILFDSLALRSKNNSSSQTSRATVRQAILRADCTIRRTEQHLQAGF